MKINFVLPALGQSGGMDVIYKYADLLSNRGHDVIVYKEIKARNMLRYKSKFKNLLHCYYCTIKGIVFINKFRRKYDKYVISINNHSVRDADVIVATSWISAYQVNKLEASKGNKYYFIQDYEVWDNLSAGQLSYELPLNKITISSWINEKLNHDLNIGPFPIVYNGIETKTFKPSIENRYKNKNCFTFLMLNHMLPKKGVRNGVRVFEMIKKKYPNSTLKMFGTCSNHNLPSYIEYYQCPSLNELVDLYSNADIFIFPSLDEGWGLTPIEAMACGCVVVGTETGFVLDIGKNRENMMISKPGDIDGMVQNIKFLIDNPELFEKIRINGTNSIKLLNWNDSCNNLENLFYKYEVPVGENL